MQMPRKVAATALAASVLAGGLAVGVGGTATAKSPATITGAQIKNGTITGADVKNNSLTGSDVKNNSLTGADVKNNSLTGADVKNNSLTGADIKDGSLGLNDLSSAAKKALTGQAGTVGVKGDKGDKGDTGAAGAQGVRGEKGAKGDSGAAGKDGQDAFVESGTETFEAKAIATIGGSWAANHTTLGTVALEKGTYLLSVNSTFWKHADTTATPSLQVQVNSTPTGGSPMETYLTTFTGSFPGGGNAGERSEAGVLEQTSSGYAVVTLDKKTTIEVDAFGYKPSGQPTANDKFSVESTLSWVQLNAAS